MSEAPKEIWIDEWRDIYDDKQSVEKYGKNPTHYRRVDKDQLEQENARLREFIEGATGEYAPEVLKRLAEEVKG